MPIEIFFCYAHEDEKWRRQLEKQLSPLKWQGLISCWHDREILAGQERATEINTHLNTAKVILLLISPNFSASDYCYSTEVKRAIERHRGGEACVIPILLRPVDWKDAPFGSLQALPSNGKFITTWSNRDEAFVDVVAGIRRAIESLLQLSTSTSPDVSPSHEKERDARGRKQNTMVEKYINWVLRFSKNLKKPPLSPEITAALRVKTLTTLRSLDSVYKGRLIRFLSEASILRMCVEEASKSSLAPPLNSEVSLADVNLQRADLAGVDLSMINLAGAQLQRARLEEANLQRADLGGANLQRANLSFSCLQEAHLCGANLEGARLFYADLQRANLIGANLENANLASATITDEQLKTVKSLQGAIMPDWSKHP